MLYIASVRNKQTKKIEILRKEYDTKKEFAQDIRGNGYALRFIATEETFDEECEKYGRKLDKEKAIREAMRRYR